MKKILKNHSDVCHKFNEQSQYEGRAGNIFFEGNKIYSYGYHYLLGEFISPNTILINNKGYSNSTAKHINILMQATRDKRQIEITRIELNLVLNELETLYKKLLKARKTLTYYFNSIIWLHNDFNINKNNLNGFYLAYNYSRGFQFVELSKTCKEQKEKLNRIEEIRNLAFEYSQSKEYLTKIERAKELEKTKAQREKEKREKQRAEQIENFYSYKGSSIYWGEFDLLRLSKCGEYLETSQAVKIPIKEAQRYFKLFSSGAKLIGEKISQYATISNDNFLQIGCHKIEHKEANRIGEIISNL
jgi:hypothetical protein